MGEVARLGQGCRIELMESPVASSLSGREASTDNKPQRSQNQARASVWRSSGESGRKKQHLLATEPPLSKSDWKTRLEGWVTVWHRGLSPPVSLSVRIA